jgi:hypothetical protein
MNWIKQLTAFFWSATESGVPAQAPPNSVSPSSPHAYPGDVVDASAGLLITSTIVLLLMVGVWAKISDLMQKRDEDTVALQARISAALRHDPWLSRLPLTPTVRMSWWRKSPVMVELAGAVPSPVLWQAAVTLAEREAERSVKSWSLVDRIAVDPAMLKHAA